MILMRPSRIACAICATFRSAVPELLSSSDMIPNETKMSRRERVRVPLRVEGLKSCEAG